MIKATIIADSVSEHDCRITTFVLTFPRIILSEFNTHRMLSRNSASSRAIPFAKMLDMVKKNPFIPIKWMKDHKGMQGTEYFEDQETINYCIEEWLRARDYAIDQAEALNIWDYDDPHLYGGTGGTVKVSGVTKQICNRLLEPFMWHTAIVTATEWENFFALRAHPDAEIHIADLAHKMLIAYNESTPQLIAPNEWHMPFTKDIDIERLIFELEPKNSQEVFDLYKKIAVARCARVSYLNFEGKDDYKADIALHDRLADSGHWSPFEHVAQAHNGSEWSGNFRGWQQYRKQFSNENKTDERIRKKSFS